MRDLERRARWHAALGDPLRLAIVDELVVSDRSPGELAGRLDVAPSLLAHHLDTLAGAGIVERVASAGDGRRRYVRLVRPPVPSLGIGRTRLPSTVLFVCTRNSARSPLAMVLWTDLLGGRASSAGTHPADAVHPGAIEAAERRGLDLGHARPGRLSSTIDAELVVTVCDRAHEELEPGVDWWHWSIPDPVADSGPGAFDATVEALSRRISSVAEAVA